MSGPTAPGDAALQAGDYHEDQHATDETLRPTLATVMTGQSLQSPAYSPNEGGSSGQLGLTAGTAGSNTPSIVVSAPQSPQDSSAAQLPDQDYHNLSPHGPPKEAALGEPVYQPLDALDPDDPDNHLVLARVCVETFTIEEPYRTSDNFSALLERTIKFGADPTKVFRFVESRVKDNKPTQDEYLHWRDSFKGILDEDEKEGQYFLDECEELDEPMK